MDNFLNVYIFLYFLLLIFISIYLLVIFCIYKIIISLGINIHNFFFNFSLFYFFSLYSCAPSYILFNMLSTLLFFLYWHLYLQEKVLWIILWKKIILLEFMFQRFSFLSNEIIHMSLIWYYYIIHRLFVKMCLKDTLK